MASSEAADGALHGGRVRRNVLRLLKGRAASALLLLASTALMARSLSPESFGLVVLIHSYLLLVRGLVNLKPFEAIIRFGVPLLERGESDRLAQLLRLTFAVDVLLALAGTGLAVLFVSVAGGILPWDAAARQTVSLYCLLLLISASGTASGILRLFNRFDLLGLRQAMGPLAQLCGVALAWWCGGDYRHFLVAFGAGFFVEHIVLLWFGYAELRRQQPQFRVRGALLASRRERFPGLSRFFNIVYWQSNVDLIPKQVSMLLVGVLLGPAAAGLFRIAQQVARVVSVLALVLRQVLFPDLSRLWFRRDPMFRRLLRRTLLLTLATGVAVALLSVVISAPVLDTVAGEGYLAASAVLSWLLLAAGLDLGVSALRAAGYAMGLAGGLLRVSLLSTAAYLAALVVLSQALGLQGVGIAVAGWACLNLLTFAILVHRRLKTADFQSEH